MARLRKRKLPARLLREIEATLDENLRELDRIENSPFDGVLGRPPEWLPARLKINFSMARGMLLMEHSDDQIQAWIAEMDDPSNVMIWNGGVANRRVPDHLKDYVAALREVRTIAKRGPAEGLRRYLGRKADQALASERARAAAARPRTDALQRLVLKVVSDHPDFTWRDVLKAMRDLCGAGVIEDIDDGAESSAKIYWRTSPDETGHSKKSPISGLKDRVSRAKKSR